MTVPVTRPILAMSLKTFMPIALIVVCAALVFFVRPRYIEGRIGLGITALLTMVALQLTSGASLPDVDYLMLLDKTNCSPICSSSSRSPVSSEPHGAPTTLTPRKRHHVPTAFGLACCSPPSFWRMLQ